MLDLRRIRVDWNAGMISVFPLETEVNYEISMLLDFKNLSRLRLESGALPGCVVCVV